jgi:hypothetical protein
MFLAWSSAARFTDNIDEGIYLDGGLRIAHGEMPYRDFFTYLAPGTFAILAALFRAFGESLAVARIPIICDLALLTALVFVLLDRLADRRTAAVIAFCYLAFQTFNPTFVVTNHRWDSSALAMAAVTCGFFLIEKPSRWWAQGAGVCACLAAWTTFSFALLGLVLLGWFLCDRGVRAYAKAYFTGASLVAAAGLGWLVANHALGSMIDAVLWSTRNYAGPNRTVYGYIIGGYQGMFRNSNPVEALFLAIMLLIVTLPATLPLASLAGWPVQLRSYPERRVVFLVVCAGTVLAATWPRPDMSHLMYGAALFYVLTGVLLVRVLGTRERLALASVVLVVAVGDFGFAVYQRVTEPALATRVGVVHGKPQDIAVLRTIQSQVMPNESIFVFPYWPIFYFTTGARNPTRYSYLQPGMFPKEDEDEVLRTLKAHPADVVIYRKVSPESYLHIWPSSDPKRLSMPEIEKLFRERYGVVAQEGKFQVMRPRVAPHFGTAAPAVYATRLQP